MLIYYRGDKMDEVENGFQACCEEYTIFKKKNLYYVIFRKDIGPFEITKEGFYKRLKNILKNA